MFDVRDCVNCVATGKCVPFVNTVTGNYISPIYNVAGNCVSPIYSDCTNSLVCRLFGADDTSAFSFWGGDNDFPGFESGENIINGRTTHR